MNCCQNFAASTATTLVSAGIGTGVAAIISAPLLAGALPNLIGGLFYTIVSISVPAKYQSTGLSVTLAVLSTVIGFAGTGLVFAAMGMALNPMTLVIIFAIQIGILLAVGLPFVCSASACAFAVTKG